MRSPAVIVSLMAVSALSPTFVLGSPLPPHADPQSLIERHKIGTPLEPRGLGFLSEVFVRTEPEGAARAAPTSKPKVATVAGYTIGFVVSLLLL